MDWVVDWMVPALLASVIGGCYSAPKPDGLAETDSAGESGTSDGGAFTSGDEQSVPPVESDTGSAEGNDPGPGLGSSDDGGETTGELGTTTGGLEGTTDSGDTTANDTTDDTTNDTNNDDTTDTGPEMPAPVRLVLFRTPPTDGNILGAGAPDSARQVADAYCQNAPHFPADECTEAHALLSFDDGDSIAAMQANFDIPDLPVESIGGTLVESDFAGLLDGTLATSLDDAGVYAGNGEQYWTGALVDGETAVNNCAGWTSTNAAGPDAFATAGNAGQANGWTGVVSVSCTNNLRVTCVCW